MAMMTTATNESVSSAPIALKMRGMSQRQSVMMMVAMVAAATGDLAGFTNLKNVKHIAKITKSRKMDPAMFVSPCCPFGCEQSTGLTRIR